MLDRTTQPELTHLEWQVVSVALNDAHHRVHVDVRPGRLAHLWRALTGFTPTQPLADPRLETLRRFVCYARRHRRVDNGLAQELAGHGFSVRQVQALALLSS